MYCTYNSTEETIIRDASTNLGNTDVYSGSGAVNTRRAIPVTFTENGKISSLSIYHHGGSGNLLMGVYLDSSGKPGTRLGVSAPTAINATEGWQEVMLTDSVLVNSGETVWLSFLFENSTVIRVAAGAPGQASSSQGWASGMPSDFGTSSLSNYNFSLYCTYNSTEETIIRDASTNLGNTDVYSGSGAVNTRRAIPVTFTENGKISSLSIYHHGGSGNLLMGVYLDSSGKPGTRLGVSAPTAINATEGWQEVMLTDSVLVNSGETVWLSFLFENSTVIRVAAGAPGQASSSQGWASGMPSDFGTSSLSNYNFSLYCTYNSTTLKAAEIQNSISVKTQNYNTQSLPSIECFDIKIYPNPFLTNLKIEFVKDEGESLDLVIFDIQGKMIKKIDKELVEGFNAIIWDATDSYGNKVLPGMYLLILQSDIRKETFKVIYQGD